MVGGSDVLLLTADKSRQRVIQQVLTSADAIVTVNQDLKNKVVARGLDDHKVHVVRRGLDLKRFYPGDRAEARRRLNLPSERKILLWVGRMEPVKGLPVLLTALQQLKQDGVDCHTLLIGAGGQSDVIEAEVNTRDLNDRVSLLGAVAHEKLADYYRCANLVVLPSLSEGVPNVLLESMACGTPFVASDVGGISEIASPGIDRLVPADDPKALATAVRERLGSSSVAVGRTFLPDDWPTAASRLIDVILPMIARRVQQQGASQVCLTTPIA
jgi:glycosyltransferase involved in cell wall biosynthesis